MLLHPRLDERSVDIHPVVVEFLKGHVRFLLQVGDAADDLLVGHDSCVKLV